ncbi:isoprenoid synthase domain-containing protein [Lyophyllum atratum]|nr:isoprenoid synthase domain-containing protein [Lyophyllum atratum]
MNTQNNEHENSRAMSGPSTSCVEHRPSSPQFNLLLDPPCFTSNFPARNHEASESIIASVQEYFHRRWEWPSEDRKSRHPKQDLEGYSTVACPVAPLERMWLFVAYNTFWFLYDDLVDVMAADEVCPACDRRSEHILLTDQLAYSIPRIFQILLGGGGVLEDMSTPESILQEICSQINDIAPGKRVFDATLHYMKAASAKKERLISVMSGFDEYFEYRMRDVGGWLALEAVFWAKNITIPEHLQTGKIRLLQELSISQAALINDLYSYRKEVKASSEEVRHHDEYLFNSLAVLVRCHQFTLLDAIEDVKKRIHSYEGRFMEVLDELRESHKSSPEASEVVERLAVALMDIMGGNAAWSAYCGRYNLL